MEQPPDARLARLSYRRGTFTDATFPGKRGGLTAARAGDEFPVLEAREPACELVAVSVRFVAAVRLQHAIAAGGGSRLLGIEEKGEEHRVDAGRQVVVPGDAPRDHAGEAALAELVEQPVGAGIVALANHHLGQLVEGDARGPAEIFPRAPQGAAQTPAVRAADAVAPSTGVLDRAGERSFQLVTVGTDPEAAPLVERQAPRARHPPVGDRVCVCQQRNQLVGGGHGVQAIGLEVPLPSARQVIHRQRAAIAVRQAILEQLRGSLGWPADDVAGVIPMPGMRRGRQAAQPGEDQQCASGASPPRGIPPAQLERAAPDAVRRLADGGQGWNAGLDDLFSPLARADGSLAKRSARGDRSSTVAAHAPLSWQV